MTEAEREFLRAVAADPLLSEFAPPWPEAGGWRCYIERRLTPVPRRIGRAVLFGVDGNVAVFRRYTFELRTAMRQEDLLIEPVSLARLLARLSRLGLWELNDFCPYSPVVDGGSVCGEGRWPERPGIVP